MLRGIMRRLSIRTLMVLVPIIGLLMAVAVLVKRSHEFRTIADEQGEPEMTSIGNADDARGEVGDPALLFPEFFISDQG